MEERRVHKPRRTLEKQVSEESGGGDFFPVFEAPVRVSPEERAGCDRLSESLGDYDQLATLFERDNYLAQNLAGIRPNEERRAAGTHQSRPQPQPPPKNPKKVWEEKYNSSASLDPPAQPVCAAAAAAAAAAGSTNDLERGATKPPPALMSSKGSSSGGTHASPKKHKIANSAAAAADHHHSDSSHKRPKLDPSGSSSSTRQRVVSPKSRPTQPSASREPSPTKPAPPPPPPDTSQSESPPPLPPAAVKPEPPPSSDGQQSQSREQPAVQNLSLWKRGGRVSPLKVHDKTHKHSEKVARVAPVMRPTAVKPSPIPINTTSELLRNGFVNNALSRVEQAEQIFKEVESLKTPEAFLSLSSVLSTGGGGGGQPVIEPNNNQLNPFSFPAAAHLSAGEPARESSFNGGGGSSVTHELAGGGAPTLDSTDGGRGHAPHQHHHPTATVKLKHEADVPEATTAESLQLQSNDPPPPSVDVKPPEPNTVSAAGPEKKMRGDATAASAAADSDDGSSCDGGVAAAADSDDSSSSSSSESSSDSSEDEQEKKRRRRPTTSDSTAVVQPAPVSAPASPPAQTREPEKPPPAAAAAAPMSWSLASFGVKSLSPSPVKSQQQTKKQHVTSSGRTSHHVISPFNQQQPLQPNTSSAASKGEKRSKDSAADKSSKGSNSGSGKSVKRAAAAAAGATAEKGGVPRKRLLSDSGGGGQDKRRPPPPVSPKKQPPPSSGVVQWRKETSEDGGGRRVPSLGLRLDLSELLGKQQQQQQAPAPIRVHATKPQRQAPADKKAAASRKSKSHTNSNHTGSTRDSTAKPQTTAAAGTTPQAKPTPPPAKSAAAEHVSSSSSTKPATGSSSSNTSSKSCSDNHAPLHPAATQHSSSSAAAAAAASIATSKSATSHGGGGGKQKIASKDMHSSMLPSPAMSTSSSGTSSSSGSSVQTGKTAPAHLAAAPSTNGGSRSHMNPDSPAEADLSSNFSGSEHCGDCDSATGSLFADVVESPAAATPGLGSEPTPAKPDEEFTKSQIKFFSDQARTFKKKADASSRNLESCLDYATAVIYYISYGDMCKQSGDAVKAFQMFTSKEVQNIINVAMRQNRKHQNPNIEEEKDRIDIISVLLTRIRAYADMQAYNVKKEQGAKYVRALSKYVCERRAAHKYDSPAAGPGSLAAIVAGTGDGAREALLPPNINLYFESYIDISRHLVEAHESWEQAGLVLKRPNVNKFYSTVDSTVKYTINIQTPVDSFTRYCNAVISLIRPKILPDANQSL